MRNSSIEIRPIAGALGAEIHGVDVSQDLPDETIADIRAALNKHQVVFFRDQKLDVAQHKAFTKRFGSLFIQPNYRGTSDDDEFITINREPTDKRIVGEAWHTDTTMVEEPPMGAILYGIEIPPYGGDTMFSSQSLAYESLSDAMKEMIAPLRAVHTDRMVAGPAVNMNAYRSTKIIDNDKWRETVNTHPVVRTHPETGRKCLFVNASYCVAFEGMTEAESKPLLDFLMDHGHRPEFTCRFRWETGSIAFWDNRSTKHIAINDAGPHRRRMRRTQISGDRPF